MMRFIACGDSLFSSRNLRNRLDPQLVELLLSADGVFTNAEFCTPNPETPPAAGRGYMTSVRPSLLDEFASLNIRMLSFVNNHTGDYGWQGVLDTMKAAGGSESDSVRSGQKPERGASARNFWILLRAV